MNSTLAIVIVAVVIVVVVGGGEYLRRRPRKIKMPVFTEQWRGLQKNCADKKTWPLAIIEADTLLDKALKTRKYKGKTTGERLVSAQHQLTGNEAVWFGHKLRNKLVHEDLQKLNKKDVLEALNGFRQALKDLGALRNDKS